MSSSNQLTQFWVELLELYKSLPQLWKVGHEGYSQKHSRTSAYEMLLEKYHEFDEGANMDHLKKKISNMRTSYRREWRKVEEDNTYTPMLWYYPHLEFLRDEEEDPSQSGGDVEKRYPTSRNVKREVNEVKKWSSPRKRKHSHVHSPKRNDSHQVNPVIHSIQSNNHHTTSHIKNRVKIQREDTASKPDEAKTLSATWEVLYRNLEAHQKLYANRVITEVLYLGALKKLNANSYKALDDQSSNHQTTRQPNPINITVDSIDYSNNYDTTDQQANINDALTHLKQLENFAVRENHEAIDLIIQLEEILKNSTDNGQNEEEDDDPDHNQEEHEEDEDEEEEYSI